MLGCLILSAALAACGGGGADAVAGIDATGTLPATTATVAQSPAAAASPATAASAGAGADPAAAAAAAAAPSPVASAPVAAASAASAPTPSTPASSTSASAAARGQTALAAAGPGGPAPVVFNASRSARAGDIVSVQGENFGSAPLVWLEALGSTPQTTLSVVNQVGTGWIAVQIPAGAGGALALRISNGSATSARVPLNAATPHHIDATQIVPGGAFRLFGRNLTLPGSTPSVTVDGQPAAIDLAASDEHMLSLTAPIGVAANSAAAIVVDNGNGSGPSRLDRNVAIVTGASGDPLGLGVGWAAGFAPLMGKTLNAATDSRITRHVVCDGKTDDSPALQEALVYVSRNGGGVVNLPAGSCIVNSSVQIFSRTLLQGAGKDRTVLQHATDAPVYGYSADLLGLRNLGFRSTEAVKVGVSLRTSSRVVLHNVRMSHGGDVQTWLHDNSNIAIVASDFTQVSSGSGTPLLMMGNAGLSFTGNTVRFYNQIGALADSCRDAYLAGNLWTRDASRQTEPGVSHTLTINFAHHIAVIGNSFTVEGGPVDPAKNDGETILTEGGGSQRTENLGNVSSATATTLTDASASVNPNALQNGLLPENYGIAIVAGTGAGQTRRVTAFSAGIFTVDRNWDVVPDSSSRYATAQWALEKAVIKGNALANSPRGIMLWGSAAREVDIIGNSMVENGGILVRAYQELSAKWFSPLVNLRIQGNILSNSRRLAASVLAVHFANHDGLAYGTAFIGVEVRRNSLTANNPNLDATSYMGPTGKEGYMVQMNVESSNYIATALPRLLGTVVQDNSCTYCATAFRLGTGASGTVLSGGVLLNSGGLWSNSATSSSSELATGTVVR